MMVTLVFFIMLFLCLFNSQETIKQVDNCKGSLFMLVGKGKDCCLPSCCAVNAQRLVHHAPSGNMPCASMHLSVCAHTAE